MTRKDKTGPVLNQAYHRWFKELLNVEILKCVHFYKYNSFTTEKLYVIVIPVVFLERKTKLMKAMNMINESYNYYG